MDRVRLDESRPHPGSGPRTNGPSSTRRAEMLRHWVLRAPIDLPSRVSQTTRCRETTGDASSALRVMPRAASAVDRRSTHPINGGGRKSRLASRERFCASGRLGSLRASHQLRRAEVSVGVARAVLHVGTSRFSSRLPSRRRKSRLASCELFYAPDRLGSLRAPIEAAGGVVWSRVRLLSGGGVDSLRARLLRGESYRFASLEGRILSSDLFVELLEEVFLGEP